MKSDLLQADALDTQEQTNKRVYHAKGVDKAYGRSALNRAETLALLKYQPRFFGRDVLDLGVGAGRTTIYLAPLARRYEALDYSPVMVEAMRRIWPDVSTHLGDIRDLSAFVRSFDFVLASHNVLDVVSHEDRLRALAEIRRTLKPGGVLMFSSHNRRFDARLRKPHLNWSRNPVTQSLNVLLWVRQLMNHAGLQRFHVEETDHAIYSDEGHDYTCLHYYIDQQAQRVQLQQCGFHVLDVMDQQGCTLSDEDPAARSPWLVYVAQAAPAADIQG